MARIGLMGCGSVADFGHLPAILSTPGLELVALFDPIPGRAATYAEKFGGIPHVDEAAFFAEGLDAVVIASPLSTHHDNVMLCSEHGVHVLCEKPIATNEDEAADMIAVMEDAGKGFFVGMVYRFSPVVHQLKRWMEEGILGKVRHIRMIYMWNLHGQWVQDSAGAWVESPMWRGRMLEGGPLVDCGVHQIDLIRWMTGLEIKSWEGFGTWLSTYEAPDHIVAQLQLENGITASVEVSFTYGHTSKEPRSVFTYEVIGTGGVARFDRDGYILEVRNGEGTHLGHGTGEKNFEGMYTQFAEFLHSGKSGDLASPHDAMVATEIAVDCTDQAIQRRIAK
jgi:predicted dehydrogenase